jgi:hypothetical protein
MIYDRPEMIVAATNRLEMKRFELTLDEEFVSANQSQRAYYFGGIIKAECMSSNAFIGFTEKEIHQLLLRHLRTYHRTVITKSGQEITTPFVEDFQSYGKKDMLEYIDAVINFLAMEFNIQVKTPEEYKYNKYLNK